MPKPNEDRSDHVPGEAAASAPDVGPYAADRELARRVVARDATAIGAFSARMQCVPRFLAVRNTQLGSVLRREELEDVAQDALIAAWRKLPDYRGEARLETWVLQFCEFELRNARRKISLRRGQPLDTVADAAAATRNPVDLEVIYLGLQQLPADEAAVLRLKHFDELTFDEIGFRLQCSPNTVKTRYYRAVENLRDWLRRRPERDA
ncbi:MAG: sigma-70 family RNA polymerase sigma factor [Planctomycetes bacterium]|nr:sigma-70 family RNA polymerase sigma factor [Planctomycetota bacterium]